MKMVEIVNLLNGKVVAGGSFLDREVIYGFATDLMSEVLTLDKEHLILITGLANPQVLRTAEMAEIMCVALIRSKKASDEMIRLAEENHITLIESPFSMFKAVSVLHDNGLKPVY